MGTSAQELITMSDNTNTNTNTTTKPRGPAKSILVQELLTLPPAEALEFCSGAIQDLEPQIEAFEAMGFKSEASKLRSVEKTLRNAGRAVQKQQYKEFVAAQSGGVVF